MFQTFDSTAVLAQNTDFRPTYGDVNTFTENGKRVIIQRMVWGEDRINYIRSLPGNITYEHSFLMNRNSNSEDGPETWAQWEPGLDGIPNRLEASSNLPEWYIDTAALPEGLGNTAEYTFGTANAKLLEPDVLYWSKMVLEVGDDPDCRMDDSVACERAQLIADLGHHRVNCYGLITPPWCIDDDAHMTINERLYNGTHWSIPVPGKYSWPEQNDSPDPDPDPNPDPDPDPVTPVPPTHDTTPPTLGGYNININGGMAYLSVSGANDSGSGVSQVRYSAKWNGSWYGIGASSQSPYGISWNMCDFGVPNGDIEFGVEIWDHAGNKWVWSHHYGNPHKTKQYDCGSTPIVTPVTCGALSKVQLSSPPNGIVYTIDLDATGITYDWNEVSSATHYEFQVSTNSAFTKLVYDGYYKNKTETVRLNADLGRYYWRVRARNYEYGCAEVGPWSEVWTATVQKTSSTCFISGLEYPEHNVGLSSNVDCRGFRNETYVPPGRIDNRGFNEMSAFWIAEGLSITIFDELDGNGLSKCFNGPVADLSQYTYDGSSVSTDKSFESFRVSTRRCYLPPAEPEEFRMTHSNPDSLLFHWKYSREVSGYHLYRWSDTERWQLIANLPGSSANYYDTDLWCNSGTQYYMLAAYNSFGESPWAGSVAGQTRSCADSAPYAPSYMNYVSTGEDYYTFVWGGSYSDGYKIYEKRYRVDDDWRQIATVASGTTEYTVSGLNCGTQREYAVRAYNQYADSPLSESLMAGTWDCTEDSPNRLPVPALTQVGNSINSITIEWNATGADLYKLLYFDPSVGHEVEATFENTGQDSYSFTQQVACGTESPYRIAVEFEDRHMPYSEALWGKTNDCAVDQGLTAPILIEPRNITVDWGQAFNLYWSAVTGAHHYRIELHNSSGSQFWTDTDAVGDFTVENGFPDPGSYTWRVYAVSANDVSSPASEWGSLTIKSVLSPHNAVVNSGQPIKLSWPNVSNISEYFNLELTSIDTGEVMSFFPTEAHYEFNSSTWYPEPGKYSWRVKTHVVGSPWLGTAEFTVVPNLLYLPFVQR